MRKPRTTMILLTVIVAVFGFGRRVRHSESQDRSPKLVSVEQVTERQVERLPDVDPKSANTPVSPIAKQASLSKPSNGVKTESLSADANALVSEMCGLHLLAHDANLSLSSEQWSAFATVVLRIQAIRQAYEAQIVTSQLIAPGRYRLEIPSYAGMGDALRDEFQAQLRTELGEAKASEVLIKLGERLEGHFAGFGVSLQTLDVTTGPGSSAGDMEVTRTVTYWNSVEGNDALTTRREVYFPGLEDSSDEGWSALLSRIKA